MGATGSYALGAAAWMPLSKRGSDEGGRRCGVNGGQSSWARSLVLMSENLFRQLQLFCTPPHPRTHHSRQHAHNLQFDVPFQDDAWTHGAVQNIAF